MSHEHKWTESLGEFARQAGHKLPDLLRSDITETKYGHRVLDQIFREGKFASKSKRKTQPAKKEQ